MGKRKDVRCIVLAVAVLAGSCQPKNDEVKREQVNPRELEAATDSVANTDKDGTATTHTFNDPDFVLPQPVLQYLSAQYAGWEKPQLIASPDELDEDHEQGPFIVNGDFNGDGRQDQVVQLQHRGRVVVLALWQQESGQLAAHELERAKLTDQQQSPYHLYLTKAGTQLKNRPTGDSIKALYDAVAVALPGKTTVYAFDGTRFRAYDAADTEE